MKAADVTALFAKWNDALQTGDPEQVVKLYAKDAILLPTMSNRVRHTHEEIKDYFVHFLAKDPVGAIDESNVRIWGDIVINSGLYTFTFKDGTSVQARFTYVYRCIDQQWLIAEHHSSQMPE